MPVDQSIEHLCGIVESAIKTGANKGSLSSPITPDSEMGSPKEWDSLSFVAVFTAVGDAYDVDLEYDDAIHFRNVRAIHALLNEILNE